MRKSLKTVLLVATVVFGAGASAAERITYIHTDALGSPVAATDASGAVIWRESYEPYGERIKKEPAASANSRWFTGHPLDDETGLLYAGARYYDPVVGRFMGVDPAPFAEKNPRSFNRFAYGNNNPYRYVDPDGRAGLEFQPGFQNCIAEGVCLPPGGGGGAGGGAIKRSIPKAETTGPAAPGKATSKPYEISVDRGRHPESAKHIEDAIRTGRPDTLTLDRAGAAERRRDALRGTERAPGRDRDEYPPAMFKEGGSGASVRPMSPGDNRGAGACIGAQCRNLPEGTQVRIRILE